MAAAMAESTAATKEYEMEEVQKHNTEDDCWLVIGGKVYDVTTYLPEHPGGADIMLGSTGASTWSCETAHKGNERAWKRKTKRVRRISKLTDGIQPGYDATDDFEDVGHSTSAREEMEKFCIGKFKVRRKRSLAMDRIVGVVYETFRRMDCDRVQQKLTDVCRDVKGRQSGEAQAESHRLGKK